jgi:hypothetical protein
MSMRLHWWCVAFSLLLYANITAPAGAAAAEHDSVFAAVAANASSTFRQPSSASPPLRGWSLEGGQAQTVLLNSNSSSSTLDYARICADHCVSKPACIAWSFGPQAAPRAAAAHDVNCNAKDTTKQCRCMLRRAAAGKLATSKKHAIVGVQAAAADQNVTYSGVVQRNITVYSGKAPDAVQPHRILLVVNFHHHFKKGTVNFITQRLYPLCLPAGIDVVIIGPHSGVNGTLLHPWTYRGHFSALSLALAYWRFPDYDGLPLLY